VGEWTEIFEKWRKGLPKPLRNKIEREAEPPQAPPEEGMCLAGWCSSEWLGVKNIAEPHISHYIWHDL